MGLVSREEEWCTALGEHFSIREYHNVVLGAGVVPLNMMETIVDRYIAAALAAR